MAEQKIARVATTIDAPAEEVWRALVTPETITRYMFGAQVESEWKEGSPIVWKGEWQGKPYEDKGVIRRVDRPRMLSYTHYSPLSGLPDEPGSYHTVTIELADQAGGTRVSLAQDNNATEQARAHSEKNWSMVLDGLKKELEK